MALHFIKLPAMLFGVGRYTVTMELPESGGLYESGNVTYRGTKVGRVETVRLTDSGVEAVLSLKSGIDIPSDLEPKCTANPRSVNPTSCCYPATPTSPPLKNGDVIALADTSVPPDINALLAAANTGLQAIPRDNLKTVIDESYTAVGGLGPELSRVIQGAIHPGHRRPQESRPADHADRSSATGAGFADQHLRLRFRHGHRNLATVTSRIADPRRGGRRRPGQRRPSGREVRQLVDRLQPTLPILMANLVSVGQVALTYQRQHRTAAGGVPPSHRRRQARISPT